MKRVVLADAISPEGVELLRSAEALEVVDASGSREELEEAVGPASGIIVRSSTTVDEDLLSVAGSLEVIGRAGVGIDNIDMDAATRRGVAVLNAPGGNTRSTTELAFALLLSSARRIPFADRAIRDGRWDRKALRGVQLHGRTLGVVGAGRIGSEVVARARAFGMQVLVYDPYLTPDRAEELPARTVELEELLAGSDFVTLHAPLTEASRGLIGREELGLMRPHAYLVNAARGGLVDESALADALAAGDLAGAALDVYEREPLPEDHPLREAPNLVMTPHLGAATADAKREVALEITAAIRDALLSGDLRAALNAPSIEAEDRAGAEPVLMLARRLGHLLASLTDGRCRKLRIGYAGPLTEILRAVASSAAVGYLAPSVDRPINIVNALLLAGERGIEIERVRRRDVPGYSNYVEISATRSEGERVVGGALLGEDHPRLDRIDDFHVDTVPRGTLVILRNRDVPGVIGAVGTRLGGAGVNIAEYHQARRAAGGEALAVIRVDGTVPDDVLEELATLEPVEEVRQVTFDA